MVMYGFSNEWLPMTSHRRFPARTLAAVLASTLVLASCQKQSELPPKPETEVRAIDAAFVDYGQGVMLTGEIVAHIQTNLSFRVSGQITEWLVDVGAHVTEGEVLARIDPQQQKADVEASEAAVRAAEAQVRQASAAFERQKLLMTKGSTTQELFDQAQTASRTANGALETAKANLGTSRDALSYTELRADAPGIVTVRNAEAGQVVQAAQTMFTVAQDGPRDAIFEVYESLLFERPAEPTIKLALVSDPAVNTEGTISEVSPTIDTATGTVRVKIAMKNTPERMTLGAPVTGFATSPPVKVLILPWTALSTLDGKPAVWVVKPDDKTVSLRPVTVSAYETGRVLVSDGVQPGEQVVVDGLKMLRPDQVVDVVKEQAQ